MGQLECHLKYGGREKKLVLANEICDMDRLKRTNLLLVSILLLLDGFVDDEIHEWIVAAQNPGQLTTSVNLERQSAKGNPIMNDTSLVNFEAMNDNHNVT